MPSVAAELLREARLRHGVTQAELARRAGTSQAHVSRIERGVVSPSVDTLGGLLRALGEGLATAPGEGWLDDDAHQRAANAALDPTERVALGVALSHQATSMVGVARR
jgi:transcriptional regulator with XRE-family HTH domain